LRFSNLSSLDFPLRLTAMIGLNMIKKGVMARKP